MPYWNTNKKTQKKLEEKINKEGSTKRKEVTKIDSNASSTREEK